MDTRKVSGIDCLYTTSRDLDQKHVVVWVTVGWIGGKVMVSDNGNVGEEEESDVGTRAQNGVCLVQLGTG